VSARTPYDALRQHIATTERALRCITEFRFMLRDRRRVTPNAAYLIALNRLDPVPLPGEEPIQLRVGQTVRVISDLEGAFRTSFVQYTYELSMIDGQEILAFHWTPEGGPHGMVTFPHLHVGQAIVGGNAQFRPSDFHRAHVPTEDLTIESIIRFAIDELGATPLIEGWSQVLDRTEAESRRLRAS
jgi:hypothetical protein